MAGSTPLTTTTPSQEKPVEGTIRGVNAPKQGVETPSPTPTSTALVKAAIIKEFGENSIMVRIAGCEGHFYQIDPKTGEALRGQINPLDRGVFQINEYYHLDASKKMGIDILTLEGNIAYARYLYDTQGTAPWNWSKECWG